MRGNLICAAAGLTYRTGVREKWRVSPPISLAMEPADLLRFPYFICFPCSMWLACGSSLVCRHFLFCGAAALCMGHTVFGVAEAALCAWPEGGLPVGGQVLHGGRQLDWKTLLISFHSVTL